jgi:hypothetical protein
LHAFAHDARRFIRERNRQDLAGMNAFLNEASDATRNHTRFPRTRSCDNQQRPLKVVDRRAL